MTILPQGTETWTGTTAGDNVSVYGNNGPVTLNGMGGDDILQGGFSNDTLNGGAGNDALYGNGGFDILSGGDGDDFLAGGSGGGVLHGGLGADTFYFRGSDNAANNQPHDFVMDFETGVDVLQFQYGDPTIEEVHTIEMAYGLRAHAINWSSQDGDGVISLWTYGDLSADDFSGAAFAAGVFDGIA